MQTPDDQLIEKALRGDETAYQEIVNRYANDLFRIAWSMTGSAADAEDIVQETMVGALTGLKRFEQRSSLKTWLIRILYRQIARHHRYWRLRKTVSIDAMRESGEEMADPFSDGEHAGRAEAKLDVETMLRAVSEEHREVLVLRELQGLSYREIADALGIPAGTVESRLFRARQELRARFRDYFGGADNPVPAVNEEK